MQEKTPLMRQYDAIKQEYPDVFLLYQVGDFYELFYEDAIKAASILGITLTSRGKSKNGPVPLCGVPVHSVEFYLKKLLDYGARVAICNQLTEPKPGTISERGVVRVFTPGTLTDTALLFDKSPSYLASMFKKDHEIALVCVELLTGTIQYTYFHESSIKVLETALSRFSPDEIIAPEEMKKDIQQMCSQNFVFSSTTISVFDDIFFDWLTKQQNISLHTMQKDVLVAALKQLYCYLSYAYKQCLHQHYIFSYYEPERYLMLDGATIRNLALVPHHKQEHTTLFSVLDDCVTPMGSRLLKKWILFPLNNQSLIEKRFRIVRYFFDNYQPLHTVRHLLSSLGDVERLVGRLALSRDMIADYRRLLEILTILPDFLDVVTPVGEAEHILPEGRMTQCRVLEQLRLLLLAAIETEEDNSVIIKQGYNQELDHQRSVLHDIRITILQLEQKEQQKTGINSLKIRHVPLYGYSIEITKNHLDKIPKDYKRLQTLSGKERYTNHGLQELERAISQAKTRVDVLEKELFECIKKETRNYISLLRSVSFLFSYFDVVTTLSFIAKERKYVEPNLTDTGEICIVAGRHPIVEQLGRFVANDTLLSDQHFFMMLTGPNMGGKSTYLRQVAIICIMAHLGSFVPASSAKITLLDRIFTRIGAGDNISEGKSTFLVEMDEVATICSYATKNSLVILDEVGRGTATKDGISIAQAIVEYLCSVVKARCLFATHYHELTALDQFFPEVVPYQVASKKTEESIVFLYTVIPGVAESSFGIEVAKMVKLPNRIIERANQLLQQKAEYKEIPLVSTKQKKCEIHDEKIKKLEEKCAILQKIDVNDITPKQAIDILYKVTSL